MRTVQVGVAACAMVTLGQATSAAAAELVLTRPSACEIGEELAYRAERALGMPLATASDVRCTVRITGAAGALTARLEVVSAGGSSRQRSFSAPSCENLTETLTLAVVLAVSSGSDADESGAAAGLDVDAAAREPSDDAPALASGAETVAQRSVQTEEKNAGIHAGAWGAVVGDAGALSGAGLGGMLGISLGSELLEARLLGTYLLPREASMDASNPGSPGGELSLAAGSLLGCAPRLVRASRLELGACGGAELGWLWGSGTGLAVSRQGGALWSALRADVAARWILGPRWLGLEVLLGALMPLERHVFEISEEGGSPRRIYRSAVVAGRLSVGVSVDFD